MFKVKKIYMEISVWVFCLAISAIAAWFFIPQVKIAYATVTNSGVVFFGDNSTTSQGVLRAKTFTDPTTWGAQINGAAASSTSFTNWIVAKAAPTREEMTIGILRVNGTLDIQTCTTGCDTSGTDFTNQWNNPGTSATQTCSASTTFGCSRPFDIGYLSLSGKAMVAYADNVASTFYYALWDGSSWTPNSAPGTPGVSNQVLTNSGGPTCTGTPKWIRVIPSGDNLADDRSDRAVVLVGDSNSRLCAFYWDGTSFDAGTTLSTTLGNCGSGQCLDGNWQGVNTFIINYTNSGVSEVRYRKYIVGTGWGADTQAYTTSTTPTHLFSAADPTSSRVAVTNSTSGSDSRSVVWRGDDATDGWTACNITNCPDTTTETVGGMQASTAFERFNGDMLWVYNNAANATTSNTASHSYSAFTAPSTWGTVTDSPIDTTDDNLNTKAWGSPNSDHIMAMAEDVDCKLYGATWTGAGFSTNTNLNNGTTATLTNYSATCPLSTTPGAAPIGIAYDYDFVFKPYSPWQRNWRFYSGSDTANTPTTGLAAENTTPTSFTSANGSFRLRINYSERGNAVNNGTSRKKLQFTSGCNPNTSLEVNCTWTDVDQSGGSGIWRYKQVGTLTDNTLLASQVLTFPAGTTCTVGNGCGTFVVDGTAAAGSNMTHNAGQTQESEWDIEANGAAYNTTYYFRIWDSQQATPIYRTQYASDCGAGSATCTYPSLTTAPLGPTTDQILRGGEWFSGGVKQSFFWAQ